MPNRPPDRRPHEPQALQHEEPDVDERGDDGRGDRDHVHARALCGASRAPRRDILAVTMQYAESILDLVGNTPLVRLTRVTARPRPARRASR